MISGGTTKEETEASQTSNEPSAGASAPEILVNEVVDALKERFEIKTHLVETATESVNFKVPRILREAL